MCSQISSRCWNLAVKVLGLSQTRTKVYTHVDVVHLDKKQEDANSALSHKLRCLSLNSFFRLAQHSRTFNRVDDSKHAFPSSNMQLLADFLFYEKVWFLAAPLTFHRKRLVCIICNEIIWRHGYGTLVNQCKCQHLLRKVIIWL